MTIRMSLERIYVTYFLMIYIYMCVGEKLFRKSYICPLAKMAPEKANRAKSAGTNIIEGGYSHMTMLAILAEMLKDSNVYWVELCYILR